MYLLWDSVKVVSSCLTNSLDNFKTNSFLSVIKSFMEPQGCIFNQMGMVDKEILGVSNTLNSNSGADIIKSGQDKYNTMLKYSQKCNPQIQKLYLWRKQFQRGRFSMASCEPFGENILARSLVTSCRSDISVL